MTMIDLRPARLDLHVRAGDDYSVVLNWPDSLDARTFEASLLGADLDVEVDDTVMTITIPDDVTDAIIPGAVWELRETTIAESDETIITGRVIASTSGTSTGSRTATVEVSSETVTVSVVGGVVGSVAALVAGLADEVAARTAADLLLIPLTQKAAANGVATLGSDGKVPAAQIPNLAIGEVFTVASQVAMLALDADRGDIAIRTDLDPDGVYWLGADDATQLANWIRIGAIDLASDGAANVPSLRTLGTGATQAFPGDTNPATRIPSGTYAPDAATTAALGTKAAKAANLSDLADAPTARTNLGLGTAATANKVTAGVAGVLDATDATTTNTRTPTDATVTPAKFAASAIDPAAGVAGARTLGTGAAQAAKGDTTVNLTGNQDAAGIKGFIDPVHAYARVHTKGLREVNPCHKSFAGGAVADGVSPCDAAFAAAAAALAPGGRFYIPASQTGAGYLLTDQFLLSNLPESLIEGDGVASRLSFKPTAPLTDAMRVVNCGRTRIANLWVTCESGSAAITHLLNVTTTGSASHITLDHVNASPNAAGVASYGIALGGDSHADLSEVRLFSCFVSGSGVIEAGYRLGDGTSGNVLDIALYGCFAGLGKYGVLMDGAVASFYGMGFAQNSEANFKLGTPNNHPIVISGVRSESSKQLWEYTGNGTFGACIAFQGVVIGSYTNPTGVVVSHFGAAPLQFRSLYVRGGPSATITNKALTANVATLTTAAVHGYAAGQRIVVAGVDATFNGTFVIVAVPTTTTFTYAKTAADVASVASGGTATPLATMDLRGPSAATALGVHADNLLFDSDNPFAGTTSSHVDINWSAPRRKINATTGVIELISAPTMSLVAGWLGTGGTVTLSGTDVAGQITIVTGSAATASPSTVRMTYASPFASGSRPPIVILTPGNANADALVNGAVVATRTQALADIDITGMTNATTYIWNYHVVFVR